MLQTSSNVRIENSKLWRCEMEDEELAALEAAAYARELELEYMERKELLEKVQSNEWAQSAWEVTEGAF